MKKIIVPFVALFLIAVISVVMAQQSGYRISRDNNGQSISKAMDLEKFKNDILHNRFIVLEDDLGLKSYSYEEAGVQLNITGYECNALIEDKTNMQVMAKLPVDNPIVQNINNDRVSGVDGVLVIDDDFNIVLTEGTKSNRIDEKKLYKAIASGVNEMKDVSIKLESYYEVDEEESDYIKSAKESIDTYNSFKISYTNGFELTSKVLAKRGLIELNEDGTIICNITLDTAKDIAGRNLHDYNTVGEMITFTDHNGNSRTMKSETYGDYISYENEGKYLCEAITNWLSEEDRVPEMKQEAKYKIGETYIEVDKTEQHVYYFKDGELVFETDVVTGLPTKERQTPSGIYFIYNKVKDAHLEKYNVDVDRWMSVTYSGVGFHDASWRNKFGGSIYKTNGSHGCINTPTKKMYELYDIVDIGTPVIIY